MLWHGRLSGCGSWLPENKKLTCGMEEKTVVAHGCQKTKNQHCGMEEKTVEAHGRLPSPLQDHKGRYKSRIVFFYLKIFFHQLNLIFF